jgi:hypothetical protein
MTRSNIYITLSSGKKMFFVADGSSAPEQGFIVEQMILPLLQFNDAKKELQLIHAHSDSINELRTNADYRYEIDLPDKTVRFFEEHYNYKTGKFSKGKDLTDERYIPYLKSITNNDENNTSKEE